MGESESIWTAPESDFDHHDKSLSYEQVLRVYADMREQCPVVHSTPYGGFYSVTRYAGVRAVTASPHRFSTARGAYLPAPPLSPVPPLEFEGAEHAAWQSITGKWLVPANVSRQRSVIAEIVSTQIDSFAENGRTDLWSEFANVVPALVIARLIGLSREAAPVLGRLAVDVVDGLGGGTGTQVVAELTTFIAEELEARRRNPQEDFLTELATGTFMGRVLGDDEVSGILLAYFIGGHYSTAAAIVGLLHHVLTIDGLREVIVGDPAGLSKVIEESLRLTTPLSHFKRIALESTKIEGISIPAGSQILVNFASANRDPRRFEDPDRFDMNRQRNQHLAFGHGVHLCLGRHLARAQLAIAVTQIFGRLPDIEIDGEAKFTGLIGGQLMQIAKLPVRFTIDATIGARQRG